MAEDKKMNSSNISLIVAAIVLLFVVVVIAWDKTPTQSTGDSVNNKPSQSETTAEGDAAQLGANEVKITADNFDAEVVKSDKVTVVDSFAPWCPHCKKVGPILTELSNEYVGKVKFGKMNSDNQDPSVKANFDFAVKNGLTGYPTVWIYKNGQKVDEISGERTKDEYKAEIDKYLK